ncbi:hypothetical protein MY3296_001850 [Beauveria thailandica]
MLAKPFFLTLSLALSVQATARPRCKTTPSDAAWPSLEEWSVLNKSINGNLIQTVPVASSCWPGNPFHSTLSCDVVKANWTSGQFHAGLAESIDYPLYSNNSCLPPGASGYTETAGCRLGGLPEFIVNATSASQVATAMKWAAMRNIRIVVKGTGHDLNGRSSGAFSLSIWTRGLRGIRRNASWPTPGSREEPQDVFIVGSGETWGDVLHEALAAGRVVTTGQDPSVGLGGYIQGGGHGPLSSTYGLAANQVLQVTIATTQGQVLVANDAENEDLFWAVRGGGGGQFGVVTEYVIRSHPAPAQVASGVLKISPASGSGTQASWKAGAVLMRHWPDLVDAGLTGSATMATGESALRFGSSVTTGLAITQVFFGYNMTFAQLNTLVEPLIAEIRSRTCNASLELAWSTSTFSDYASFYKSISGSDAAGGPSLETSRLLGRAELVKTPLPTAVHYLQTALQAENSTAGMFATVGLQGGPGIANVPEKRWGAVNPAWRSAYVHFISGGVEIEPDKRGGAKAALAHAAAWLEDVKEGLWRRWAPTTGAYMNEANPYNTHWKEDYYGSNYGKLLEIKNKYDPTESLYVLSGVGSDKWDYNLDTGRLCKIG